MAESDTMFEYAVYMDQRHPSISKHVVIVWALKARAGMAKDKNITQIAQ